MLYLQVHDDLLKLRKKRILLPHHYDVLYPSDGADLREKEIDITLWVILARNLTTVKTTINWDIKEIKPEDDLKPHHILRYVNQFSSNLNLTVIYNIYSRQSYITEILLCK